MRKYLISATAFTLLAASSAWSDPPADRGNRGHEGRAEQSDRGPPQGGDRGRGPAPQAAMQSDRGEQNRGFGRAPQMAAPPNRSEADRGGDRQMGFDRRRLDDRRAFNDNRRGSESRPENRPDNRAFNDNRRPDFNRGRPDFNRDGRTDFRPDTRRGPGIGGPRHDFSGFRDYHRSFHVTRRFYAPAYRRPAGWYEHRWTYGEFLPAAFWVRDYWIIDYVDYDLPPPPFGAVWVRVGPDALLVDEDTGEIITVAYDVFY